MAKKTKPRLKRGAKTKPAKINPRLKRGGHILSPRFVIPEGFTLSTNETPKTIETLIRGFLNDAEARLPDVLRRAARARVHVYRDGTIDGELMVRVPYGISGDETSRELEEAFGHREVHPNIWIQTGVRYSIHTDDIVYRKFQGMNEVNVYYQRSVRTNVANVFVIQREAQLKGMSQVHGRKAEMIYVRLHWNKENARPERDGRR